MKYRCSSLITSIYVYAIFSSIPNYSNCTAYVAYHVFVTTKWTLDQYEVEVIVIMNEAWELIGRD